MAITNSDLMREIKRLGGRLDKAEAGIEELKIWRISTDAAQAAVDKYKKEQGKNGSITSLINKDLLKIIFRLLVIITTALGLITYLVKGPN